MSTTLEQIQAPPRRDPGRQIQTIVQAAVSSESLLLFAGSTAILLALAGLLVLRYHFYFDDAVSRAFIAGSVLLSDRPAITNLGFIWAPLPSAVQIPLTLIGPLVETAFTSNITSVLFAAGSLVVLNRLLEPWVAERRHRWIVLFLYQTHPMILLYAINGMSEQLLLFFTLVNALLLRQTLLEERIHRACIKAMLMGLVAGAAFLSRYEGVVLGLTISLLVTIGPFLLRRWRLPAEVEAALLAYGVPFTYVIFLWVFFNWTIMGNPLYFITGGGSNVEQAAAQLRENPDLARLVGNLPGAIAFVGSLLAELYPAFFLGVIALVWAFVRRRDVWALSLLALALMFPLFQLVMLFFGLSFGWLRFHLYIIPFTVSGLAHVFAVSGGSLGPRLRIAALSALMVVSSVVSGLALTRPAQAHYWETRLIAAIQLVESGRSQELEQRGDIPTFLREQRIAAALRDLPPTGKILADERFADQIIVFTGQFDRFLTSRDPRFSAAAKDPAAYVAHVLVGDVPGGRGILEQELPTLFAAGDPRLRLVAEWPGSRVSRWRLYEAVPT